jgi:hypothetical protein
MPLPVVRVLFGDGSRIRRGAKIISSDMGIHLYIGRSDDDPSEHLMGLYQSSNDETQQGAAIELTTARVNEIIAALTAWKKRHP